MKNNEPDIEIEAQAQEDLSVSLLGVLRNLKKISWGKLISANLHFILWLTFLGMMYIGNIYHAERIARQTVIMSKQVDELRAESITTANELMNMSRESVVAGMVQERGLSVREATKPPYTLK